MNALITEIWNTPKWIKRMLLSSCLLIAGGLIGALLLPATPPTRPSRVLVAPAPAPAQKAAAPQRTAAAAHLETKPRTRLIRPSPVPQPRLAVEPAVVNPLDDRSAARRLVREARKELAAGREELGRAMLASALSADPTCAAALDLLQQDVLRGVEADLRREDLDSAGTRLAALVGLIDEAGGEAREAGELRRLAARRDALRALAARLAQQARRMECRQVQELRRELEAIEAGSQKDDEGRLLQRCRLVQSRLIELPRAGDLRARADRLARCIEQRRMDAARERLRKPRDEQARKLLARAQELLATATRAPDRVSCQWTGERLAEAEELLARVDPRCAKALQEEVRTLQGALRSAALANRTRQRCRYSAWAVEQLEEAHKELEQAKGYAYDDKQRIAELLLRRLGPVDLRWMLPPAATRWRELLERGMSRLDLAQQIEVARGMAALARNAKGKKLGDF